MLVTLLQLADLGNLQLQLIQLLLKSRHHLLSEDVPVELEEVGVVVKDRNIVLACSKSSFINRSF